MNHSRETTAIQSGAAPGEAEATPSQSAAAALARQRRALARQPWVSYALVLLNIGLWLATLASGAPVLQAPADKMLSWGGNAASEVQRGEWWRLLTAVFLHSGLMHLGTNMGGLLCTGPTVERVYGSRRFLLLYLGAGLAGSAMSLHFSAQSGTAVGASGAVFGVAGALLVAALRHRRYLPTMLSFYTLAGVGLLMLDAMIRGLITERVDNAAHIGGLLAGGMLALILPERISGRHGNNEARLRTLVAAVAALAVTATLALSAPPAAVDMRNVFQAGAAMEKALRDVDLNMGRMALEEKAAQTGRISQKLRDERRRLVYAPAFRQIGAELAAIRLQQGDARGPLLRDLRRMAALLAELSAMESAFSVGNARPAPVDPARQAEIIEELRQVQKRILAWRDGSGPKREN